MASIHERDERLLEAGLALGVSEFITTGVTVEERAAIGHIPRGRGVLGC
jgi:hypothetical protein